MRSTAFDRGTDCETPGPTALACSTSERLKGLLQPLLYLALRCSSQGRHRSRISGHDSFLPFFLPESRATSWNETGACVVDEHPSSGLLANNVSHKI